jgi:hypothetical protein
MDSRIRNLVDTIIASELNSLLNELCFAIDGTSLTDANKVFWTTLITNAIVTNNSNNYQAMTPQAFYNSIMTTSRNGIGMIASDAEVIAKTGTDVLTAIHQVLMQTQWKKDWFTMEATNPKVYIRSADSLVGGGAIAWQATRQGDLNLGSGWHLNPVLEDGVFLDAGYVMVQVQSDTARERGTFDYSWSTGEFIRSLGSTFQLNITDDKRFLILRPVGVNRLNTRVSLTAHFTTR